MTTDLLEISKRLLPIFFPYAARCRERMVATNGRFVHYTTAANALSIINTKRIWMRNTTCMSDYREVQHGLDALNRYFGDDTKKQTFFSALNECSPGSAEEAFKLFNDW